MTRGRFSPPSMKSCRGPPTWSASMTARPRCRTAPAAPGFFGPRSPRAGRIRRPCLGPRLRRAARSRLSAYDAALAVPLYQAGDVDARVWVRIREIEASVQLLRRWLAAMPEGPVRIVPPATEGDSEG